MTDRPPRFGVNLNNREPLIAPDYTLSDLLVAGRTRRGAGIRFGLGGRQPLLQTTLGTDHPPLRHLAAHKPRQARHRLHGLRHPQPALPRARMGDARPALQWPHHPRHRHGQSRRRACGGSTRPSVSISSNGPGSSRRGWPSCASSGRTGETSFQGEHYRLRPRLLLLRNRDGAARSGADAAADLGGQQPAPDRRHQAGRQDGARRQPGRPPHRRATAMAG